MDVKQKETIERFMPFLMSTATHMLLNGSGWIAASAFTAESIGWTCLCRMRMSRAP